VGAQPLQAINHPATVATWVTHDEVVELCKLVVVGDAHIVPLWPTSRQRNLVHSFGTARRPGRVIRGGGGLRLFVAVLQIERASAEDISDAGPAGCRREPLSTKAG
jgi:hypothetical protein